MSLIAFIISIYFLYRIVGPVLDKTIFSSHFLKGLFVLFFYMILLQSVILTSWLFVKDTPLGMAIPLTFGVIALLFVITFKYTKTKPTRNPILPAFHLFDILAIVMALAVTVSVVFSNQGIASDLVGNNVHRLVAGADDESHQKMFEEKIANNRGILYQTTNTKIDTDYSMYPAGWHSANAAIAKAFYPNASVGNDTLIAYSFSKIFWLLVLLILFVRVVITVYKKAVKSKTSLLTILWLVVSLYILGRVFVADVYVAGAYSFVPQHLAVLFSLLLLLQFSKAKDDVFSQRNTLFLLGVVAIGACLSWILVLPAFAIGILALAFLQVKNIGSWAAIRTLFVKPVYIIPIVLLATAFGVQLYIMFTTPSPLSVSFIDGINLGGVILMNGIELYLLVIAGIAIYLSLLYKTNRKYFTYLLCFIVPLFVYSQIISVLQLITVGQNGYYYFKIVNLLVMLLLPLSIVGFAFALAWLESRKLRLAAIGLFFVLFLACLVCYARTVLHLYN